MCEDAPTNVPTNGAFFDWSGGWSEPRWVTAKTMLAAVLKGGADVEDAEDADEDEAGEEEADGRMAGKVRGASAWGRGPTAEEKGDDAEGGSPFVPVRSRSLRWRRGTSRSSW